MIGLSKSIIFCGFTSILIALISYLFKASIQSKNQETTFSESLTFNKIPIIAYGISGFCALGYEVIWVRSFIETNSGSVYAFSIVLIIYLFGSTVGAKVSSMFIYKIKNPMKTFSLIQFLIALSIIVSIKCSYLFQNEINLFADELIKDYQWTGYIISLSLKAGIMLFIPTFLFGYLFPIVVLWTKNSTNEIGSVISKIYSYNTIGAILGSFFTGFVIMPILGLYNSILFIVILNLIIGLYFSIDIYPRFKWGLIFFSVLFLMINVSDSILILKTPNGFSTLFYDEGSVANVAVYQNKNINNPFRILKVNGVYQSGGTNEHALKTQRKEGHLPMLLHNNPKDVLVIG